MTDQSAAPVVEAVSPLNMVTTKKSTPSIRVTRRPAKPSSNDPDRFLNEAKRLVVDNYNEHRDKSRNPPLTADLVHILWFTKSQENWTALVGSSVTHGLIYEVSFVAHQSKAYITVYKRINKVTIAY